jgi:hypothetical protein
LPDLQVYYDVPAASFLLPHRGQWIALRQLPPMYRSYDLYAAPKVVLDYDGPTPYQHYEMHRQRFPRWYCPPHSVIEHRDAPPSRGYVPGRHYRHPNGYRHDRRYGDGCDGQCTHEHHAYGPRNGNRPYPPRYEDDDCLYEPGQQDDETEQEYDYYGREETGRPGHRGRWR